MLLHLFFRFLITNEKGHFIEPSSGCFRWRNPWNKMFKMFYFKTHLCGYFRTLNEIYLAVLAALAASVVLVELLSFVVHESHKISLNYFFCILIFSACMNFLQTNSFWFFIHKNQRAKYSFSGSFVSQLISF